MKTDQNRRKYLSEYRAPDFTIKRTSLSFNIDEQQTRVTSCLQLSRQTEDATASLRLDGIGLSLLSLSIDGAVLQPAQYEITETQLIVFEVADEFEFSCEVEIDPSANTSLEGLYLSSGNFCTQCEAEGFRRITYYIDRPDVMSVFETTISAAKAKYPVVLSNGVCVDSGESGERHWFRWSDPYPKPSYLFALVVGDLACINGTFVTASGRSVDLQFFTEHHNKDKCAHALTSLQKAMKWDEETYGLEYDLDLYMVVAVDDFNMGAMENKGLNVFNTKYVLANPETATDSDFLAIEGVIAHEYFHNWTGNRVTCRDWFQLSLKEGLTVFRDQQFSADMTSAAIQRINDVRVLRNHQFAEDAGPMAHPIRPASYQEINNFYTATVYNKGAEVVRMIHTLLGVENFRKGMDLYFQRHDGQAVTTDDFRQAMADASGVNLDQFQLWYEQSGTPKIEIKRDYDQSKQSLILDIIQHPGETRGKPNQAFHLPMRISLFDPQGGAIKLDAQGSLEHTVDVRAKRQQLKFKNIYALPLISALRGFSAPVLLETDSLDDELAVLMSCDSDPFNRWEAGQQYASRVMLGLMKISPEAWSAATQGLAGAYRKLLLDKETHLPLVAEMMVLPSEKYLGEMLVTVDVHKLRQVREYVKYSIARVNEERLHALYVECDQRGEYRVSPEDTARRRMKNTCLGYLLMLDKSDYFELCSQQFETANNMTDQIGCLQSIVHYRNSVRDTIVDQFYQQWQDTALVVDKWFSAQAMSYEHNALAEIIALFEHKAYTLHNPNRARSLLGALIANSSAFHDSSGLGYEFVAQKIIELDVINPQVAARMANSFLYWRKLIPEQGELMKRQIEMIGATENISNDLNELMATSLMDSPGLG
ncbi:MAG: aminopeptidase N [Gammaproteobacteria bacterium]|nr:aminopeptidase N [Gammaproteobacteria bacterium]